MNRRPRLAEAAPGAAIAALLLALPPCASALGLERTEAVVPSGSELGCLAPAALAYDELRDVLAVACPAQHRVVVTSRAGTVVKELGKGGELRLPRAVAVSRRGTLYVASPELEALVAFERYTAAVGEEPRVVSLSAHRGATAVRPVALFADDGGDVYVADRGNRQVLVLDEGGKLKRTLRDVGEPADVWASRGAVYVADPAFGGVRVFDDAGRLVRTIGTAPGQLREPIRPKAVAVDRAGRVWLLEEGRAGLKALDAFGNVVVAHGAEGLSAPADLAIDPRGTLFVLEEGGSRIATFRISGGP